MKAICISVFIVLFLAAGLASAQTPSGNGPASGDSHPIREALKPVGEKVSNPSKPARSPELILPFSLLEPPKRFLWGDVDNDGLKDLFVLDFKGNLLFRNLGNGGFEDVTKMAFPDGAGCGMTGFFGDYNADGFEDLFLFQAEGFTLFQNDGKLRFSDVTEGLGVETALSVSDASLEDFDNDGFDDLILETPEGDRIFRNDEGRRFGEVDLPEPERRGGGLTTSGWPPKKMDKKTGPMTGPSSPGGMPLTPEGVISFDTRYVNDNSPGSVGLGIPEVEGGDDASVLNDIVDGTIAGTDLGAPFEKKAGTPKALFNMINSSSDKGAVGVRGESAAPSGRGVHGIGYYGIYGESQEQAGVYGRSTSNTGTNYGVYGFNSSPEGMGVFGKASATSGYTAGVKGECDSTQGYGVLGVSTASEGLSEGVMGMCMSGSGIGVYGFSLAMYGEARGVYGASMSPDGYGVMGFGGAGTGTGAGLYGKTSAEKGYGVKGEATAASGNAKGVYGYSEAYNGYGVYGETTTTTGSSYGVYGKNNASVGAGVYGRSPGIGVWGYSEAGEGTGVYGSCFSNGGFGVKGNGYTYGVYGSGGSNGETYGVYGRSNSSTGYGVYGEGPVYGVFGRTTKADGLVYAVRGESDATNGIGVYGKATKVDTSGVTWGVFGESVAPNGYGVYGVAPKIGVYGWATGPDGYGGYFKGRTSTDILEIRGGSDLSERFDIRTSGEADTTIPGAVVCIDPERTGRLRISQKAYDRTVAGIISGAGGIQTGMLMGQEESEADGESPVALTGRVYCLADAARGAIVPGDLLTTSDTPGHAMKVADHEKAQGAILGKAMSSLEEGRGLVLVLVTLQ